MWRFFEYQRAEVQRYNENFGSCQPFEAVFWRGYYSCLDVQLNQWEKSCRLIDSFNPHFKSRQLTGKLALKIFTFLNENTILHNMSMQCLHALLSRQPHVLCVYCVYVREYDDIPRPQASLSRADSAATELVSASSSSGCVTYRCTNISKLNTSSCSLNRLNWAHY